MNAPVTIVASAEEVATQALGLVLGAERRALADHGDFRIALSGGSTPRRLHELLSASTLADFRSWHVFFGDERWVPPGDPDSNWRMARETLLDQVPIPAAQVHPVDTLAGSPEKSARLYAMTIARKVPSVVRKVPSVRALVPVLDLVLLGLGPDGHTASLFPGAAPARAGELVAAVYAASKHSWRITMTARLINAARSVVFLVAGADKAEALSRVIAGDPSMPASAIRPEAGELRFLADAAAASRF